MSGGLKMRHPNLLFTVRKEAEKSYILLAFYTGDIRNLMSLGDITFNSFGAPILGNPIIPRA